MSNVDAFMAMMNCDQAAASHYLDMSQGDLDTAIALYFSMNDSGQSDMPSSLHRESAPDHSAQRADRQHSTRQQVVVVNSDADSDDYMEIDRDDSSTAQSAYASDLHRAIAQRDSDRQQAAYLQQQHRLFKPQPSRGTSFDSFANYSEPERSGSLSQVFGLPVFCINANPEISTFLHAKQAAASMFKKLIVNILDQTLTSLDQNRDLWGHDDVAALVVEHYCLFQLNKNSDAAAEYLRLYSLRQGIETHKLPIIDILDPLTGMLIQRLSGAVAARQLCSVLRQQVKEDVGGEMSFDQSSYTSPPPVVSHSSHASASMASQGDDFSVWSSLGDGGDEDYARAIAASLGDPHASAPLRPRSPARAVSSAQKVRDETDQAYKESLMRDQARELEQQAAALEAARIAREEEQRQQAAASKQARFDAAVAAAAAEYTTATAPPPGPGTVNIAVKFPSGKRPTRRFMSSDLVSRVYDWVLSTGGTNGRGVDEFLLCTAVPPVTQLNKKQCTLEHFGISGQVALVMEDVD